MVQAAVTDIVGPAVTAKGPDALFSDKFLVFADHDGFRFGDAFKCSEKIVADLAGPFLAVRILKVGFAGFCGNTLIKECLDGIF